MEQEGEGWAVQPTTSSSSWSGPENRGLDVYATHLQQSGGARIVAVADPSAERRELAETSSGRSLTPERWDDFVHLCRAMGPNAPVRACGAERPTKRPPAPHSSWPALSPDFGCARRSGGRPGAFEQAFDLQTHGRCRWYGYDVLVEKPLAPTLEGCLRIVAAAETATGRLQVAHVLRHAPFFRALHDALDEGLIGALAVLGLAGRPGHSRGRPVSAHES
jgi:hypothetical protein